MSAYRASRAPEISLPPKDSNSSKRLVSSLLISLVVHALVLFVLSFIYFVLPHNNMMDSILVLLGTDNGAPGDGVEIDLKGSKESTIEIGEADAAMDPLTPQADLVLFSPSTSTSGSVPEMSISRDDSRAASSTKIAAVKIAPTGKSTNTSKLPVRKGANTAAEVVHTDHFQGRGGMNKAALLKRMGGTDESEAAVAKGLRWLKNHQLHAGSWSFDHRHSPLCDCTMPGLMDHNANAATAMALLAFLGAGQTNESGDYQTEVQKGIDFLLSRATRTEYGTCFYGDLVGPPTYYTHALVTITLSEAFAMTGDARLRPAISGAIDFLAATQESGGGWRYAPGMPGDTSVVAWQLMALKSAQFSRITVPQKVFTGVDRFMHSVSSMRGSQYAYIPARKETPSFSMTAAGLLCRMYLDWKDNGGLQAGIRVLDEHGPEPGNMYYNYYATQVMHHWGGPEWERWNKVMREHLIRTQMHVGHCTGSWEVTDPHGVQGGRLYMTTLALLTLEVYYRHLPLYQKDRIELPLMNQAAEVKSP